MRGKDQPPLRDQWEDARTQYLARQAAARVHAEMAREVRSTLYVIAFIAAVLVIGVACVGGFS